MSVKLIHVQTVTTLESPQIFTNFQANELLQAARINQNQLEKRKQLLESLKVGHLI